MYIYVYIYIIYIYTYSYTYIHTYFLPSHIRHTFRLQVLVKRSSIFSCLNTDKI